MNATAEELEAKLAKSLARGREVKKYKYQLLKTLGFSSSEAVRMVNWSEENILTLARERGYSLPEQTAGLRAGRGMDVTPLRGGVICSE